MKKVLAIFTTVIVFSLSTLAQAKSLIASVDRNLVNIADTFTLQLEAKDLGSLNQPDFSALDTDFEVLSKSVSHNIQNINGVSSQSVVWQLQLQAKRLGDVEIPVFELEGESSQPIAMQVKEIQIESADNLDFKLQLVANKEQVKVDEQVLITLKFFYSKYVNNLQNTDLELASAKIFRLDNREYETQIQGKKFGVFEISYAVFPNAAGMLDIPAQQISVQLGRSSIFNTRRGRTITLRSDALQIPVENLGGSEEEKLGIIVADSLTLSEKWPSKSEDIVLGDSLTREINLTINGALTETIPAIAMNEQLGIKIYPEAADKQEQKTSNGVFIQRSRKFAIVPTQAGTFELPEINYQWWNAIEQKMEVARLPAKRIQVSLPAGAQQTTPSAPSQSVTPQQSRDQELDKAIAQSQVPATTLEKVYVENKINYWLIVTNIISVVGIVVLVVLLLGKRKSSKHQLVDSKSDSDNTEQLAFNTLIKTCESDDLNAIYLAFQSWSRHSGVSQWHEVELQRQSAQLQQVLFSNHTQQLSWSNTQFVQSLHNERKHLLKNGTLTNGKLANNKLANKQQSEFANEQFALYPTAHNK